MSTTTKYYRALPEHTDLYHFAKEVFEDKQAAMAYAEQVSLENNCRVELIEVLGYCIYSPTPAGRIAAALVDAGQIDLAEQFIEEIILRGK